MELVFNAVPLLGKQTGVGHYARQIAQGVAARPDLFSPVYFYGYYSRRLIGGGENGGASSWIGTLRTLITRQPLLRRICKKTLSVAGAAWHTLRGICYDCYFEPNFVLLPSIRARHAVLTAHDFSCFLYPQWHPAERVRFMERHFRDSLQRADAVITVSEAIRREALELFGLEPERVHAIPNGVDLARFHPGTERGRQELRRRLGLPERFILHVGTMEPRKNLQGLLAAHAALPEKLQRRFPLLLAGASGWKNAGILEDIAARSAHVHLLGYVADADLAGLYDAADALVYPSWYEGFGLPALEALACGCPTLISTDAALLEVCGDAALSTPPDDTDAMSARLRELLENETLRADLRRRGPEQAARFRWETSVQRHLELFTSICAQ